MFPNARFGSRHIAKLLLSTLSIIPIRLNAIKIINFVQGMNGIKESDANTSLNLQQLVADLTNGIY